MKWRFGDSKNDKKLFENSIPAINRDLNNSDSSVNFSVKAGASFNVFGSDFNDSHFNSGTIFLIAVKFTDGSRAAGPVTIP